MQHLFYLYILTFKIIVVKSFECSDIGVPEYSKEQRHFANHNIKVILRDCIETKLVPNIECQLSYKVLFIVFHFIYDLPKIMHCIIYFKKQEHFTNSFCLL